MNFAHRKNLFSIFFKPLIIFQEIKLLLEKEKQKMTQIGTVPSARPRNRPQPASLARALPAPRPQPGSGPTKPRGALARLGRESARSTGAVRSDPTAAR